MINLLHGDCLEQMKTLDDNSVDSIVSDPPYGISFMAKKWDYDVPSVEVWKEAMRVLKPGGHALIACGTRTQHRMVVNIEDAGFEIRDVVSWIYGSGFPKSLNISKAIDKAAGAEREVVGVNPYKNIRGAQADDETQSGGKKYRFKDDMTVTAPATEAAKQWDGWGTALKPSCEFFTLCRKPLSEKTIAKNVLKWGTGGINIDGCRVGSPIEQQSGGWHHEHTQNDDGWKGGEQAIKNPQGRFPANLIHDGSQEVLELFPESGEKSPARFFYCAKASKKDRDEGLDEFEEKKSRKWRDDKGMRLTGSGNIRSEMSRNNHPTVKPTALMSYLCRLITPTGGVVLDPYMGSGSTGKAAVQEGFSFVGCELDPDYYEIAKARVNHSQ
jgi:site-specific DNA-methyltransferase (adenine-specific)